MPLGLTYVHSNAKNNRTTARILTPARRASSYFLLMCLLHIISSKHTVNSMYMFLRRHAMIQLLSMVPEESTLNPTKAIRIEYLLIVVLEKVVCLEW